MPQPFRVLRVSAIFAFFIGLFPPLSQAGTWVAFQGSYTRGTGAPVTVTDSFALLNSVTQYTLKAFNGGLQNDTTELVSNSVVYLNGVQVIGPANFNQSVTEVSVTIFPGLTNTLSVQVRGKPGGVLALQVIGVDNDPPSITASVSPSPNAAGWNNSPVTVSFTCSDKTSGVASCPSPITISAEGANQVVPGTATDLAGNTATTSVTVNLDMTPPTIIGTISPPPDAGGWNSSAVTVTFTCADTLSGVASCSLPVAVTTEGAGQVVTGTATDVAGNTASTTITVNISFNHFTIRSWQVGPNGNAASPSGKCLDYGVSPSGATVFLNDCSQAHPIRVVEITPSRVGSRGIALNHEVMLFAGKSVIGIHNPRIIPPINPGTSPSSAAPATEYALELQYPFNTITGGLVSDPTNQIFRLDGDSIILEGSSVDPVTGAVVPGPCINTVATFPPLCPDPQPQLVIQVQNARGANGSPLVAAVRNLADNEFWDFNAIDGSGKYPTQGFVSTIGSPPLPIGTADELWNAVCSSPLASPTPAGPPTDQCFAFNVGWGSVIVVSSPNDCTVTDPLAGQTQDIGGCIDLSAYPPLMIPAGVTLRGNRRGANFGPQLYAAYSSTSSFDCDGTCMLEIQGDYARVTGLRVRGQSRSTDKLPFKADGIWINYAGNKTSPDGTPPQIPLFPLATVTELIATVDHNDASDWMDAAVTLFSPFDNSPTTGNMCSYRGYIDTNSSPADSYRCDENTQLVPYSPYLVSLDPSLTPVTIAEDMSVVPGTGTLGNTRVARNFLHHNMRDDGGYGVGAQGRALIDGNTFVWNRHDIESDGEPHHEYRASHNLVLSSAYEHYGFLGADGRTQDFDMHGTANPTIYYGGAGGYYVEIDGNTFLGPDGHDYVLRGYPVVNSYYHNNVSRRNENDAIHFNHCVTLIGCVNDYHSTFPTDFPIYISNSQFADSSPPYADPTTRFGPGSLGVGDFDGDGDDDLFLATGVAWYYSPAGAREWRFLNGAPDTIDQLLFGDFDGDGRTDVVAMRSGQLLVSWGGISTFEVLNHGALPCSSMSDMAVGDFDGDGHPDIFCADGTTWWVSFGGNTGFVPVQTSSFRVAKLGFGDFNGDGTTDVLGVVSYGGSSYYQVSYSPKSMPGSLFSGWTPLQPALTTSVASFMVADFNGDGVADIFAPSSDGWQISYGGTQPWTDVPQPSFAASPGNFAFIDTAAVGHFTGQRQTDVLLWNGTPYLPFVTGVTELLLSAAALSPATAYSTQDMR